MSDINMASDRIGGALEGIFSVLDQHLRQGITRQNELLERIATALENPPHVAGKCFQHGDPLMFVCPACEREGRTTYTDGGTA